jgi:hypothetical protein
MIPTNVAVSTAAATIFIGFALVACQKGSDTPAKPTGDGDSKIDFVADVKPLLTESCLPCHHSETLLGELNLESRTSVFGGGDGGTFIVPGEPDNSLIYTVTENPHGKRAAFEKMPAMKDIFLTEKERGILRRWIEQGAIWPSGADGRLEPIKMKSGQS